MKASNYHDTRESWLRAATTDLRPYFTAQGYPLPDKIRFAIGFPSTRRKGNRVGECWHASTSAYEHFEIFIRADLDEPEKVLGVLVHELVHAVVPIDANTASTTGLPPSRSGWRARWFTPCPASCCRSVWMISRPLSGLCLMPGSLSSVEPITVGLPTGKRNRRPAITR